MKPKVKVILGIVIFAVFIAAAYFAYGKLSKEYNPDESGAQTASSAQPTAASQQKTKAPDFTVYTADGAPVKLSDFIGKPVVLNFWASWCGPCKSEMPLFNEVYQTEKDNVEFVMVNLTDGERETIDSASEFVSENGYLFPVYFDTEQDAAYAYGISSIPTTLFIDKDGYVVAGKAGVVDEESFVRTIGIIKN